MSQSNGFYDGRALARQKTIAEIGGGFGSHLAAAQSKHYQEVMTCSKAGMDVMHDPVFNKGLAFTEAERERLGLRGLIPPTRNTIDGQVSRVMERLNDEWDMVDPEEIQGGGVTKEHARQWLFLQELQDRNETLFYKVLLDNFTTLAPVIYTPTVGWVCTNLHHLYRRPRGMFFSAADQGCMAAMVYNWPGVKVDAIVVTDGSRILGLGDLGINGLGISIGKLDLYVAAAGFHPRHVLPCVLDVGTNNKVLRNDPMYFGLKHDRVKDDKYYDLVDEFEDFATEHAQPLLDKYRENALVFNDDIQGTACVAVSGIFGALAVLGKHPTEITQQTIVLVGAGSAGMGVAHFIRKAMMQQGLNGAQASAKFWVLDHMGLITRSRRDVGKLVQPFQRTEDEDDKEGQSLLEVVKRVTPTILIGLAGAGRLFTKEVLEAAAAGQPRPIIFPMSNPTSKMECTSEDAFVATKGKCVFASGSPQPDVEVNGKVYKPSQSNNMYIFPGLAFGAHLGDTGIITDEMLMAAAMALPKCISGQDLVNGQVYPPLKNIRDISLEIAAAVMTCAHEYGHLHNADAVKALQGGDRVLRLYIASKQYKPAYQPLVRVPAHLEVFQHFRNN